MPLLVDHVPRHETGEICVLVVVGCEKSHWSPHCRVENWNHGNYWESCAESILGVSMVNAVQNEVTGNHEWVVWQPRALGVEEMTMEAVLEEGPHKHSKTEGENCFKHTGLSTAQKVTHNWNANYRCHKPWSHRHCLNEIIVKESNTSPGVYEYLWIINVIVVFLKIPLCIHHLPP